MQDSPSPALPPRPEGGLLPAPPGSQNAVAAAAVAQQNQPNSGIHWVAFDESPPQAAPASSSTNVSLFSSPSTVPVQQSSNQSFGTVSVQSDPFANDPFFGSSTPSAAGTGGTTQQMPMTMDDKFAAINSLQSQSTWSAGSNPFGESSIFGTPAGTMSSTTSISNTFDNQFDVQEPPKPGLMPGVVARTNKSVAAPTKRDNLFSDLVGFGADVQPDVEDDVNDVVLNLGRGGGRENKDFIVVDSSEGSAVTASIQQPGAIQALPSGTQPASGATTTDVFGTSAPLATADPFVVNISTNQTAAGLFGSSTSATSTSAAAPPVSVNTMHPPISTMAGTDDPFDTSAIFLPPVHGPFDTSQLQPHSVDTSASSSLADTANQSSGSFTSPDLPSPIAPPPPLPQPVELPDEGPVPPPRPGTSCIVHSTGTPPIIHRQQTIDIGMLDSPPPPPPRPPATDRSAPTVPLRKQSTIDSTIDPPPTLPPRVRPAGGRAVPPLVRADSVPTPPSRFSARIEPAATDPFAVTLPQHTKIKSSKQTGDGGTITSRPRPRPRPHTPGSGHSPLSQRSYSPHATDSRHSESPRGSLNEVDFTDRGTYDLSRSPTNALRSTTPSSVKSDIVQDPFANSDPFSKDPFKDQVDPFKQSPSSDPFTSDFTKQEKVFHTEAVTAHLDPFADDPFGPDPFAASTQFGTSNTSSPGRGHIPSHVHSDLDSQNKSSSLGNLNIKPAELHTAKKDPAGMNVLLSDLIQGQFQTFTNSGSAGDLQTASSGTNNSRTVVNHMNTDAKFALDDDFGVSVAANQNSVSWKDGDSSSNSEIGDAFSVDNVSLSGVGVSGGNLPNGVSAKQQANPFSKPFQTSNQVL